MTAKFELQLKNLNQRPYVHGTSIVKGVLDIINTQYMWVPHTTIKDFSIRLRAKLMMQPTMVIDDVPGDNPLAVAGGKFLIDDHQMYYRLYSSNRPCTDILVIDEKVLGTRLYETADQWCMDLLPDDDVHVCLNEVSKISNQAIYASIPGVVMTKEKQTWFVGYQLPSLEFMKDLHTKIGVSKQFKLLSKMCTERQIYFNDVHVGSRLCIYA